MSAPVNSSDVSKIGGFTNRYKPPENFHQLAPRLKVFLFSMRAKKLFALSVSLSVFLSSFRVPRALENAINCTPARFDFRSPGRKALRIALSSEARILRSSRACRRTAKLEIIICLVQRMLGIASTHNSDLRARDVQFFSQNLNKQRVTSDSYLIVCFK